jgi:hypothetical protein
MLVGNQITIWSKLLNPEKIEEQGEGRNSTGMDLRQVG